MFLPISTDAPLYYRPIGTLLLIAANMAAFIVTSGGEAPHGWILRFGDGLHPQEWLLNAFLHFGWGHLVGNLFFLWVFGLVVEGKIGPWRFVSTYLALCAVEGLLNQVLMLQYAGPSSGAGGASGVIFALMMIALLWAPENCVEIAYGYGIGIGLFRTGTFDVRIKMLAAFYLGVNLLFAWLQGFSMSSELLHLIGAALGVPVGIWFLKTGVADCEGWDLFSVWRGDHRHSPRPLLTSSTERPRADLMPSDAALPREAHLSPAAVERRVKRAIAEQRYEAAADLYQLHRRRRRIEPLEQDLLQSLIDGLVRQQVWKSAAALLEEYIMRFPQQATQARLALAGLLARELNRPRAALDQLARLDDPTLQTKQRNLARDITALARKRIDDGHLELSAPVP